MKKYFPIILIFYCSLNAMEEQPRAINIKNHAQVISLTEALMRNTFSFEGRQESDLLAFPDYQDASTLYRFPFNSVSLAVKQIVVLQSGNTFNQRHTAIFNRYPRKCRAQQAELLDLYESLSENDIYWLAIESFKTYYKQSDLVPHSKNDEKRNLSEIKENRRLFFASLEINDVDLFKSVKDKQLTKKPCRSFLTQVKRGILLIKTKGQDVVDSPENSDDDNMPHVPESEKNDVSEIVARLQKLNHGN